MPISIAERLQVKECDEDAGLSLKKNSTVSMKEHSAMSLVQCDLSKCTREQIKEYFANSFALDEMLFSALKEQRDFLKCPDRLRLPLVFYIAHTASVYVNKLVLAGLLSERVNKDFEKMFETGVDEMSWDDTENYRMGNSYKWPSISDVLSYRQEVHQVVQEVIDSAPLELPVKMDSPFWSVFMGMEHERIHLETSSVLLRQLPVDLLERPKSWKYGPHTTGNPVGPNDFVTVSHGKVVLGKPRDFPSYGWDNEYGQVEMDVPEFEASKYLITNREFLQFVQSNGYQRSELWTDEGWKWVEFRRACHPVFWVCDEGCKSSCGADLADHSHCLLQQSGEEAASKERGKGKSCCVNGVTRSTGSNGGSLSTETPCFNKDKYMYRAVYDVLPMPWDWPVEVNYHEAKAFCVWKGPEYRVPTEAEHHRMRGDPPLTCDTDCDPSFNLDYPANINFKFGSSTPVNMFPPTSMGFYDVYGNVWEWVEDHFNGLPGFKTSYLYDDFSTPCFDGRHTMITGGSWISTGDEASRFARFAFRRHFIQHLGFRLVRSKAAVPVRLCKVEVFVLGAGVSDNPVTIERLKEDECFSSSTNDMFRYETSLQLDTRLQKEFGNMNKNGVPMVGYMMDVINKYSTNGRTSSAVVFGCGGGLTSFLLTKAFDKVVGVDYCGRFIDAALAIQSGRGVQFGCGQVVSLQSLEEVYPMQVSFKQMTWIPNEIEGHELVLVDFLERLSEPRGWLLKLWECMTPKGLLVITASAKWDRDHLLTYIGKWFTHLEDTTIGDQAVTVWQLK